jgi:hypothetical protein
MREDTTKLKINYKNIIKSIAGYMPNKPFPFAEYEEKARLMTDSALLYSIRDCIKARDAMKNHNTEAEGWYQDEASVYQREIIKRRKEK